VQEEEGDQDEKVGDSHRSGNAAANAESVRSTMFPTMHGDKKREGERYTARAPSVRKWKDSHEAKCVLSLREGGNGSCGGTLHRVSDTQMDPGQRMAFGTFSEHGQNDWRLDTAGDEAYLDDFVLDQVPRASRSRSDVVDYSKVEVRNPKEGMILSSVSISGILACIIRRR
jgi:hypothetical protein